MTSRVEDALGGPKRMVACALGEPSSSRATSTRAWAWKNTNHTCSGRTRGDGVGSFCAVRHEPSSGGWSSVLSEELAGMPYSTRDVTAYSCQARRGISIYTPLWLTTTSSGLLVSPSHPLLHSASKHGSREQAQRSLTPLLALPARDVQARWRDRHLWVSASLLQGVWLLTY